MVLLRSRHMTEIRWRTCKRYAIWSSVTAPSKSDAGTLNRRLNQYCRPRARHVAAVQYADLDSPIGLGDPDRAGQTPEQSNQQEDDESRRNRPCVSHVFTSAPPSFRPYASRRYGRQARSKCRITGRRTAATIKLLRSWSFHFVNATLLQGTGKFASCHK